MPALFIGHGSPMNTLEVNRYTSAWRELGRALPRPRGVLVVSAHWYFGATAVTAMARPRTIHDFYGFPDELFAFEYPAPGLPELGGEVADVAKPLWVGADRDQWGIDHGAWSVLAHLFPEGDVPVVQLSINALRPIGYHLELGTRLAELRRRRILVLASGNVVHNLSRLKWNEPDSGEGWAHRFDEAVIDQLTSSPADILKVAEHPDYGLAVPTPDHFIPLLYLAGLATAGGERPEVLISGHTLGSISMTSYGLCVSAPSTFSAASAAGIPAGIPPDQTNI
jgi:4,5-DOPA dioxygenase extradiol